MRIFGLLLQLGLLWYKTVQRILVVDVPSELQVARALQRDQVSEAQLRAIMPTLAAIVKKKIDKKVHADAEKGMYWADEEYHKELFNEFIKLLDKKINEAKDMLLERFNHICSQSPKSARFMYENHTMSGYHEEEGIISALKHGTLAIGQLGMSETLYLLFGFDHTTEKGMEYAKQIEDLFKKRQNSY